MSDSPTSDPKAEAAGAERGRQGPAKAKGSDDKKPGKGGRRSRKGRGKGKGRDDDRGRDGGGRGGNRKRNDRGRGRKDRGDRRSDQPLTAGLFAGVADREMPCRIAGCTNTWTWYGSQQIRSLGKAPPKRMCSEHLAQLEGIEDREMPCRNSWCKNTWTWTRGAQLYQRERNEKLKPPHRLCDSCFKEERGTEDTQVSCRIPECDNTWTWTRQAQLRHRAWVQRQLAKIAAEEAEEAAEAEAEAKAEAAKAEGDAAKADADAAKTEAEAAKAEGDAAKAEGDAPKAEGDATKAEGDAAKAEGDATKAEGDAAKAEGDATKAEGDAAKAEGDAPKAEDDAAKAEGDAAKAEGDAPKAEDQAQRQAKPSKKRKRKRKKGKRRRRKIHEGPPDKLCERCFERMGHLEPIEVPCKVHGCTRTWTWDREGQLRAWAAHDKQDKPEELPQPPRRMCNPCFDFVRNHPDREVPCGRPDCDKTWTYKTGAQLQDYLAGRTQDPIRLCEHCLRSQFTISEASGVELPEGAEVMPCQVAGCSGSWVYVPGMELSPADPDAAEAPVDRMCDDCRGQRGAEPRDPRRSRAAAESMGDRTDESKAKAEGQASVATDESATPSLGTEAASEPEASPEVADSSDNSNSSDTESSSS